MSLWTRIVGVLLILLGLVLVVSPRVPFTQREEIRNTQFTVRRQKIIRVPRALSVLVIGAGILVFVLGGKSRQA